MSLYQSLTCLLALNLFLILPYSFGLDKFIPVVITTWDFHNASRIAWDTIYNGKRSAIDAIENGCSSCEDEQCDGTVGYGGSPDENGETTLDAMLMDGVTMNVGAVGGLRNVKNAISVARRVLENTAHSLLIGSLASDFALKMGFSNTSLQTDHSRRMWRSWQENHCQPNFWKNVSPNPTSTCGPYQPKKIMKPQKKCMHVNENNHDTIGMIAIDMKGHIAAGTSTNGARNKIPGRVGDSPIAGAGAYADQEVGAAAATGDGDVMMRFLPSRKLIGFITSNIANKQIPPWLISYGLIFNLSFLAVELMRNGVAPGEAAETAIRRISKHYPNFSGAVIALNKKGKYGAACHGELQLNKSFPYYAVNQQLGKPTLLRIKCH